MNIPDEAVEAAVDALLGALADDGAYIQEDDGPGNCVIGGHMLNVPATIRKALVAAAPHLMASAWDEGRSASGWQSVPMGSGAFTLSPSRNPYRKADS